MKYPKEYLDEIKTRLKVSTVVSKSVSLKKRGKEFVGLSPFKTEKTPSFTVNDEKEFYHCFATSEHGNIFDFVMKTQNLKFGEAVKSLANLAGMRPYTFSKQDEEREKNWQEYCSIYNQYVQFYHDEILKNESFHFLKFHHDKIEHIDCRLSNILANFFHVLHLVLRMYKVSYLQDLLMTLPLLQISNFEFSLQNQKYFHVLMLQNNDKIPFHH